MLWDSALRAIFPAETVQLSRERQAAIMTGEHLAELLREADAAVAAAQAAQAAAECAAEASAIEALGVKADAAAALQRTADLEGEVRRLSLQRDAQAAELEAQRRLVASLGRQLEETARPSSSGCDSASTRRVHTDTLLASASKQAVVALSARDAALKQLEEEAARRTAAEAAVQKLEVRLAVLEQQLQQVKAASAVADEAGSSSNAAPIIAQQVAVVELVAAQQEVQEWKAKALAAEGQAAEATAKAEALTDSLWPLTTRIRDLEAALTARTTS